MIYIICLQGISDQTTTRYLLIGLTQKQSPLDTKCCQGRGQIGTLTHCCTGMSQRDGKGREVGGGFRMGNTSTPMADS